MTEQTGDRGPATGNGKPAMRIGNDIAQRLLALAVSSLKLAGSLPKNPAGRHVALQLVRAATGSGANYEEARAAESRADFVHKLGVAAKEARETAYWLGLVHRAMWTSAPLEPAIREANELAAILGASMRTARTADQRRT
jgi:four helix bundle protein